MKDQNGVQVKFYETLPPGIQLYFDNEEVQIDVNQKFKLIRIKMPKEIAERYHTQLGFALEDLEKQEEFKGGEK